MGRMRRRMCDLPPKLVGEKILTKVPITSLRHVRSTCKLWEGLSKDWVLGKEAASRTQQFLGFMTMDSKVCSLRFNLRSKEEAEEEAEAEAEEEAEEEEEEEAVDVSIKQVDILDQVEISQVYQCEGLLLCVGKDNSTLVAWNPYLGQTRTIEPRKSFHIGDMYALGYDKKTRNHKILRYLDYHDGLEHLFAFEIYDFGSNSWRLVEVRPDWEVVASPHRAEVRPGEVVASRYRGVSLKGDTYFFAREKIGPDFFDPTLSSSRRSSSIMSLCFGVQDCDDFLLCFDFTREKMGPRLPLPFHTLLPLGEVVSLSCVREEQLAVLFQHGGEAEIFEELDVWVTTRIEPKDVSWTKFLTFDMRPLTRFGVGQLHDHASFFIDEQEKVAVVFDVVSFRDKENEPGYHSAFIIGQGGYFKSVLLGEAPNVDRPDRFWVTEYCPPLVCSSSYLPSLVQIKFNQFRKRKRELVDDVDTKVSLKKQKKDVIAAVQKEKSQKKVPKKVESSDSEEEEVVAATKKPAAAAVKAKAESSSSEEDSSDDEPAAKPAAKSAAAAKPAAKDSSSSDDESEDESEDEKPAAKKAAPAKAASSSSDEESDEESEDEKPAPKKAKAAKKDSSSSDESESESEDEEKTPKKKSTDVEMVDAEQKQPKTPATPSTGGCKTLFVGNLSFQVEQKDVEEFFKGAGEVVDVRFATSKEDGRFRGFGHVEFASAEAAAKAMELNGQALLGRDIRLDIANERGERPAYTPQSGATNFRSGGGGGGTSVFVKGFDSSLPENDIKSALSEHFASCGEISRISVPCDRETGASKGIAYLDFKDGADKAFALNGSDLGGWSLVVDEARPRDNSGGGFNSGGGGGRGGRGGRGRDSGRGGRGGRFSSGGRGGRDSGGRGFNRPNFTSQGKKTTFSDE